MLTMWNELRSRGLYNLTYIDTYQNIKYAFESIAVQASLYVISSFEHSH
jgi:hypothetical protein